ncbi:MAG: hypothetical protein UV60_C0015G0022 [Parcubacteria group bacterium GW2011_GWA2_43_11]|nr:MAG: hypothetical protein UV60_C0015G0022 [Parcubacteria group bacterium GW2011_GWA2_43_11]
MCVTLHNKKLLFLLFQLNIMPQNNAHRRTPSDSRSPHRRPSIRTFTNTNVNATNTKPVVAPEKTGSATRAKRSRPYVSHDATRKRKNVPKQAPTRQNARKKPNQSLSKRSSRLPIKAPHINLPAKKLDVYIPPVPQNAVRVIPLGGYRTLDTLKTGKKKFVLSSLPMDILTI